MYLLLVTMDILSKENKMKKSIKIRPLIEIAVFHSFIYIVFYYLNTNPKLFFSMNPHPFLIGVIGFALFYGNQYGLIAMGTSVIMYGFLFYNSFSEWRPLITEVDYFKLPLTFLWVGTTIGLIVDNHKTRQFSLEKDLDLTRRDYKKINNQYQLSQKALSQLKNQIIDSDESIIALYDIAKRLQELDEDEILTETVGVISKYLKASQVMIYHYGEDHNYIRFILGVGIDDGFSEYSINIKESPFYQRVLESREVLRYSDIKGEDLPLLIGPLIKNDEVIGLVMVREMSFDFISNYAFTLFKIILDWINQSLNNVVLVEQQQKKYIDQTDVLTFTKFKKRLQAEKRRYKEYGLKYVLFAVEAPVTPLDYADRIKNNIRAIDKVTLMGNKIYILLPATDGERYPDIEDKIFLRLDFNLPKVKIGDDFE